MKRFFDDCFLFVPDDDFSIICGRQKSDFNGNLRDFCSLSTQDVDFVKQNLASFSKIPFIVGEKKPVFVITGFYPSSNLCFAIVPDLPADVLAALCNEFFFGQLNFSESFKKIKPLQRIRPSARKDFAYIAGFLTDISAYYGLLRSENTFSAARKSCEIFEMVSDFIGCEFDIDKHFPIGVTEGFDLSLVLAFALSTAIFVRRAIDDRTAKISFDFRHGDLSIIVTANCKKQIQPFEFEPLRNYFTNNNYDFAIINQTGELFVDFCPMRRDFARLGIKDDPPLKL